MVEEKKMVEAGRPVRKEASVKIMGNDDNRLSQGHGSEGGEERLNSGYT